MARSSLTYIRFLAHLTLQVSYCYHWVPVVRLSLAFCILINFSKTAGPIWTKLWWNGPWVVPFQNCVRQSPHQQRWLPLLKIENSAKNHLKIIFSETAGPIGPKLWWYGLQMVLFENCVRRPRPPTKIAPLLKIENLAKNHLKIISSETTGLIGPKLWWNGL
jgi:hypothetical protein